jgi:hypothetical protein
MRESSRFDALVLFLITVISAVVGASDSRAPALHKQVLAGDSHAQSSSQPVHAVE